MSSCKITRYPLEDPPAYANTNYRDTGGKLVKMRPNTFLKKAGKPLKIDESSRENIDDLKHMMCSGKTIDPPVLYVDGKRIVDHDGRHRAVAARELGLKTIPVLLQPKRK